MSSLLNRRLMASIKFHDMLHSSRAGRSTGIATLEAKTLQHLRAMREAVLSDFSMDIQKAYDALDWDRCLGIMVSYGVGPRTIRLLRTY